LNVQSSHGHCRQHLSPQKTPSVWCRVEAFPLIGSGKIQKFMLRDGYLAGDYQPFRSGRLRQGAEGSKFEE
jgi:fatty-acyl-CoA synthase